MSSSASISNRDRSDGETLRRRRGGDAAAGPAPSAGSTPGSKESEPLSSQGTDGSVPKNKKIKNAQSKSVLEWFFLSIPAAVWWAILIVWTFLILSVAYLLQTRFGPGRNAVISPVDLQDPAAEQSAMEIIAELPVPPGGHSETQSVL
jgi:hypothetical protein